MAFGRKVSRFGSVALASALSRTPAVALAAVVAPVLPSATPLVAPRLAAQVVPGRNTATQSPAKDTTFVVDRVAAVVGNRAVLSSQIEEEILVLKSEGVQLPRDEEGVRAMRKQILNDLIDEELLVQQAQRDTTIKVSDEEVNESVAELVRNRRRRFDSEAEFRADLKETGFQTPEEYRRWLADRERRSQYQKLLLQKLTSEGKLKPVVPSDQEIRAYFDAQKRRLPKRPATLSFRQIVITPKASPEAREQARLLADSIAKELRKQDGNFAAAARRFSDDPGSRELGGELNWFRRGVMTPEFERVAFALKPGTISPPVESPYGYHIIQVQQVQPAEVRARHILITPKVDSVRVDSARALADSIHRLVAAGASFDSLQRIHHDRSAERTAEQVPIDKLPEQYAQVMAKADSGAVVPVFMLPSGRPQFVVAIIVGRRPEGDIRLEDVRSDIIAELSRQLAVRRYVDGLKSATFVEVRS